MKYTLSLLFSFVLLTNLHAQKTGIQFSKSDWKTNLKQAKKADKLIFVDAYTTWCGPCKYMTASVFPDKAVGDFYNENFINVKMDMEKGEGIEFAKTYQIRAYPTLLFINGNGEMVHKGLGGRPTAEFISLGEAATDPSRQLGTLEREYNNGNKEPELMKSYALSLIDGGMPMANEIAMEYLKTQIDWKTEENLNFIFQTADWRNIEDKLFRFVAENREEFIAINGESAVNNRLKIAPTIMASQMPDLTRIKTEAIFHKVFPDNHKQFTDEFEMNTNYGQEAYIKSARNYLAKHNINDSNQLNEIAWNVYELTNDSATLKLAKEWAKKSIDLDPNYMNYDTLAAICFKLKEKREAMKYAKTAIDLAKANGEDTSHTDELLKKIKDL